MTPIRIPRRRDVPEQAGYYLAEERGNPKPLIAFWSGRDQGWKLNASRVAVVGWVAVEMGREVL